MTDTQVKDTPELTPEQIEQLKAKMLDALEPVPTDFKIPEGLRRLPIALCDPDEQYRTWRAAFNGSHHIMFAVPFDWRLGIQAALHRLLLTVEKELRESEGHPQDAARVRTLISASAVYAAAEGLTAEDWAELVFMGAQIGAREEAANPEYSLNVLPDFATCVVCNPASMLVATGKLLSYLEVPVQAMKWAVDNHAGLTPEQQQALEEAQATVEASYATKH